MAAVQALGLIPDDEVIVPALTFSGTAAAAHVLGLRVVFVDVDPQTLCLDHRLVEQAITSRTKAIMVVHLGDGMADMDALTELCRRHRLYLVEDCAHAHGACWQGRPVGGLGDVGCFSFQTSKLISCGEGGAITTQKSTVADACAAVIDCGRSHGSSIKVQSCLGINLRLPELQAALLTFATKRFSRLHKLRHQRMESLRDQLQGIQGIRLPLRDPRVTARPTYAFTLVYQAEECGHMPRERFLSDLNHAGFPVTPCWYEPVYRSPEYGLHDPRTLSTSLPLHCPMAEWATDSLIWIPHPFFLGPQRQINRLARTMERLLVAYRAGLPGAVGR
jgi:dTDP-4-amino-4,6-dideoxygalactose transaminase